ncbi:MAG: DUF5640 domain-containing protein [Eubacterium sp.]
MKINFKKLSKKQVIILAVVIVLLIVLIPSGIYCGIHKETPSQMLSDIFKSDETLILAKWQSEQSFTGYEFYEDGTYDSYISTFSFTGNYKIEGKKLILSNPNANSTVTYKFSINGDKMTLSLIDENGTEPDEKEELKFNKVDHFNMKSITDIFEDYANDLTEESTTDKSEE